MRNATERESDVSQTHSGSRRGEEESVRGSGVNSVTLLGDSVLSSRCRELRRTVSGSPGSCSGPVEGISDGALHQETGDRRQSMNDLWNSEA